LLWRVVTISQTSQTKMITEREIIDTTTPFTLPSWSDFLFLKSDQSDRFYAPV